jgi:3-deoxy-D-manno-octulosonic-acid transferase
MYNFITIAADFESRNAALRVHDEKDLVEKTKAFFDNPAAFAVMGQAAATWTQSQAGVIDALMADCAPFLLSVIKKEGSAA